MTETTTTEEIEITDNVFVPCPIESRFDNVRVATACRSCGHFVGLIGLTQSGTQARFARRFRVNCAHPVSREMLEVKL